MAELAWGRRYLLCPPDHFGVVYEINPWMHREVRVDRDRAREQWQALRTTLETAGADVEVLDPHPEVPDLVFTANAGVVNGTRFVAANFRHPERRAETPYDVSWFESQATRSTSCPRVCRTRERATPSRSAECWCPPTGSGATPPRTPTCRG